MIRNDPRPKAQSNLRIQPNTSVHNGIFGGIAIFWI